MPPYLVPVDNMMTGRVADAELFSMAVSGIVGKRVTFDELTGQGRKAGMKDALPEADERQAKA